MLLYKIGEFSKINKISQRMLRYYDEKSLYRLDGPFIEKYYTDRSVTIDQNEFVTEVSIAINPHQYEKT